MSGAAEFSFGGKFVLDTYDDGVDYLRTHLPAYAGIFASPAVKRDASGSVSVAWYSESSGVIQKWDEVDAGSRNRAETILRGLVRSVLKCAEDKDDEMAQLVLRWLHVLSLRDDLMVIDGQPVITNWGIVPEAIIDDPEKLLAHFEAGLGRFASDVESSGAHARLIPPVVDPTSVERTKDETTVAETSSPPPTAEKQAGGLRSSILPVALACVIAFIVLLLLLIPGVLVYPQQGLLVDRQAIAESEAVLRQRIEQMKSLLDGGVCRAPEVLSRIDDVSRDALNHPQAGPSPQSGGRASIAPISPATAPLTFGALPSPPSALRPQVQSEASSVVDLLEKSTVLVVGQSNDGGLSLGTGFFVTPTQVVTNRHVVEGANPQRIYVTNGELAGARMAGLQAMTQSSDPGSSDFALLNIQGEPSRFLLPITTTASKGDNVLAAGFPNFFMETDAQFEQLLQGSQASVPSMVLTQGIVTVFQTISSNIPLVLHSADISRGNSGGPLVDYCGRAIGVNTFIRTNDSEQIKLNAALKSDALFSFLHANSVAISPVNDVCNPTTLAANESVAARDTQMTRP